MKKKVLLSSIATIALCLCLIAGSTYALFTSSAKVNVSATAGKVEIYATVDENSISSGSTLDDKKNLPETSFTFDATSNTITLDKIVPGDYVDFNIKISNTGSDVSIKYRTVIKVAENNGLWSGLVATIDGEPYMGEYKNSAWEVLAPGANEIIVPVRIELPAAAGNEYQGKSCKIAYLVEAVQMNGTIMDAAGPDELADALATAVPGSTINLDAGDFGTLTLDSELRDITIVADDDTVFEQIVFTADADVLNLVLSNVNADTPGTGNFNNGFISIAAGAKVENLVIEGGSFVRDTAANTPVLSSREPSASATFVGTTFEGCKAFYSNVTEISSLTFDGCIFQNFADNWTIQTNAGEYNGDLTIKNCTFNKCTDGLVRLGNDGKMAEGTTFTFVNNTITACADHVPYELFRVRVGENATAIISDNKMDGQDFVPSDYGLIVD